jgi:predicted ATPase/class 3 adenylate cyclase
VTLDSTPREVGPSAGTDPSDPASPVTYLFSDIEGSTRLWEQQPERMRPALARHDAISRAAVLRHRGTIVKMTGDGVHAAFDDPVDALASVLELQQELAAPDAAGGIALKVRCGLHLGSDERRRGDFFGPAVNRAARIMSAAHGGQILLSQAVAERLRERLPRDVTLRDLGSVRLRHLSTPERVFQVVHPRLRADFPALRSLEATPNNLPQQLNSFIGRERELEDVRALLATSRLVTLIGMGGLGKSRLSVQLGADVMDDYPDGVWLVELAALSDPLLVPQAAASVLGVKEEAGHPVLDALVKFVRDRQLLLILDNCEHVVQSCAELAKRLLQAGPRLKILASSRDALQTAGETVFQLAPLAAPRLDAPATADALTRIDAVRLFVDRSTAAQPAFRLTDRNAAAVAEICQQLDGIPLALELAAARARALSVEAIAARLKDRFKLLVAGDRTVLPRQRTLRALIDWSYDLLAPAEAALFRTLSVFAGGCTLEAAEAVGAHGTIAAGDVLDLLTRLVEKSLVIADLDGGRYRMLDTVRQYAHERLLETAQADAARDRHLAFYVQLVETARTELVGPNQGPWLERLDRERENILAAHARCDSALDGAEAGLRLIHSIRFYLLSRGLLALGERLGTEALARPGARKPALGRCRGLAAAGQFCFYRARYREARAFLAESLEIARALGDESSIVGALQPLGMACLGDGDLDGARRHLEEAVELAQRQGNKLELAAVINALAQLHRLEGRLDLAEPLYDRVLALARDLGDQDSIAIALLNKAMVAISRGAAQAVAPALVEALDIGTAIGSRPAGQSVIEVTSALAWLVGDHTGAARFFGAAEAQAEATGLRRDPTDEAFLMPLVALVRAALGETAFADAERAGRALSYEDAIAAARTWLLGAARPPASTTGS